MCINQKYFNGSRKPCFSVIRKTPYFHSKCKLLIFEKFENSNFYHFARRKMQPRFILQNVENLLSCQQAARCSPFLESNKIFTNNTCSSCNVNSNKQCLQIYQPSFAHHLLFANLLYYNLRVYKIERIIRGSKDFLSSSGGKPSSFFIFIQLMHFQKLYTSILPVG